MASCACSRVTEYPPSAAKGNRYAAFFELFPGGAVNTRSEVNAMKRAVCLILAAALVVPGRTAELDRREWSRMGILN